MTSFLGFGLGGYELWIILAIFLLLFGHRIPGMARSMGSGIVEFKKGLKEPVDDSSGKGGSKKGIGKKDSGKDDSGDDDSGDDAAETDDKDSDQDRLEQRSANG